MGISYSLDTEKIRLKNKKTPLSFGKLLVTKPKKPKKERCHHYDNEKSEWLAILSTDTTLSNEEIVRIYGMRWDIETFFKFSKSFLHLAKEFQGRSYDMMISHTTIVFTRYILIAWQLRKEEDPKTMGNLFLFLCDEVKEMDFKTALLQLISLFQTLAEAKVYLSMDIFQCQLSNWITSLPRYIKDCLHISVCES
ncbi:transposase [Bacillus sp. FSL W8-1127]|uniref:transposase n=1 Tax=Bacillus TaxID=1386 RepID=UPI00077B97E7|nr:transposase [Bacillus smithii]